MSLHTELITNNLRTTSLIVAEKFGKRHNNVLQAIHNLLNSEEDDSLSRWGLLNFKQTPYVDAQNGQTYHMYEMTRDGFSMLVMGFTGKTAMKWKIRFIEAFNAMEKRIKRQDQPPAFIQPEYTDPLTPREWLAVIRETRLAHGNTAARAVYDRSPFAEYLQVKDAPSLDSEKLANLTDEQFNQLGFKITVTEFEALNSLKNTKKNTHEISFLCGVSLDKARDITAKLSAFDLIKQDWHERKKWRLSELGLNVILVIDANNKSEP